MRKVSEKNGRFEKTYTDSDFIQAVREGLKNPMLPAVEVARLLDCSRDFAKKRIKELEKKGLIESEIIGNMLFVRLPDQEGQEMEEGVKMGLIEDEETFWKSHNIICEYRGKFKKEQVTTSDTHIIYVCPSCGSKYCPEQVVDDPIEEGGKVNISYMGSVEKKK